MRAPPHSWLEFWDEPSVRERQWRMGSVSAVTSVSGTGSINGGFCFRPPFLPPLLGGRYCHCHMQDRLMMPSARGWSEAWAGTSIICVFPCMSVVSSIGCPALAHVVIHLMVWPGPFWLKVHILCIPLLLEGGLRQFSPTLLSLWFPLRSSARLAAFGGAP